MLIKDAVLNGKTTCIRVENHHFTAIAPDLTALPGEEIFDCAGKLAIQPAFYNTHTHAAMSLLRGFADDLELFPWLNDHIWPMEAKLTQEDVYNGVRLACVEMIRSGTVFFNEMYFLQKGAVAAAEDMGIRACIGILRQASAATANAERFHNDWLMENKDKFSSRIQVSLAPHAIYTVTGDQLAEMAKTSAKNDLFIHIHAAETKQEFDDCMKQHGMTVIRYLDSLGVLTPKTILAHAVHLTDDDIRICAERGCVLAHNPVSNMKLCSGTFRGSDLQKAGCRLALGTDGAASNNNLSMFDEMKTAAILAKLSSHDPKVFPAGFVYDMATKNGAEAFGIHAGVIAEGYLADAMFVNLDHISMIPAHHLVSNLVYAGDPGCIDSVLCDGKFLMKHGVIDKEDEIKAAARQSVASLTVK